MKVSLENGMDGKRTQIICGFRCNYRLDELLC